MELRLAAFNAFVVQNSARKVTSAGVLYPEEAIFLIANDADLIKI
jgi:hypothetical protein